MEEVVLGICSSISIYKSCEIIRSFQKKEVKVQVIMTKNASHLISPLLFSALTGRDPLIDLFSNEYSEKITHIEVARKASLLIVAPATANIIGKFANGIADDFLSTFFMAFKGPILIAPAMNESMYLHRKTQENIHRLEEQRIKFIGPEKGYLACKDEGIGRLAAPDKIVKEGLIMMRNSQSLKGRTVMVTAGPTREFMDPVRFLTNRSSGKMGYELSEEVLRRGAEVILISGPASLIPPQGVKLRRVQTAKEMEIEVFKHLDRTDIIIMTAAVSDFRFSQEASKKIKKSEDLGKIELVRNPDILKKLGEKKGKRILVGFAAETENLKENAVKKMIEKNLDLIVVNDVSEKETGFESDYNKVSIIFPDNKIIRTGKKSKCEISQIILDKIEGLVGKNI